MSIAADRRPSEEDLRTGPDQQELDHLDVLEVLAGHGDGLACHDGVRLQRDLGLAAMSRREAGERQRRR